MDGLKNNNYKIARNAHSVERKPSSVMSVESFIKEERNTMEKIKIADAKNLSKNFNLSMEQIQEKYEIVFPVVSGGKGMSVLESIKSRDKTLVELPAPLEIELSNLGTGQKLQVLKDLVASLNQSDDFKRETQIPYPLLVDGLQVEFNWKDRSKINKK